jgi:AraC family transcriptional regulator, positive regulator of tynA and feaB
MHDLPDEASSASLTSRIQGWQLQGTAAPADPSLRKRTFELGGTTVIDESLPLCSGHRPGAAATAGSPAHLAVVYIAQGREWGYGRGGSVLLEPGTVVVWHTTHELGFRVIEPLRKFTFLFPERDMAMSLPRTPELCCAVIKRDAPLGAIVGDFFGGLTRSLDALPERYGAAALSMAREVIAKGLAAEHAIVTKSPGDVALERLVEYINLHLREPTLSPETLARAQGISVRYLHQLFSRRGLRVASWIRQRRLEGCRMELATAAHGVTITEIALKWGFNDSAHFSRLFSSAFGTAPKRYRERCQPRPLASLPSLPSPAPKKRSG